MSRITTVVDSIVEIINAESTKVADAASSLSNINADMLAERARELMIAAVIERLNQEK